MNVVARSKLFGLVLLLAAPLAFGQTVVVENDLAKVLPRCAAPSATVVVGKFQCKAQGCQKAEQIDPRIAGLMALAAAAGEAGAATYAGIGDGMSNALTTALKATNCFDVQEREALEELRKEMELAGIKLEAKPADFMIAGAVTSVGLQTERTSVGGGFIPIIGAVTSKKQIANLAMDIRVIEVKTATVKSSKAFMANSESQSWGVGGGGLGGGGILFGGHAVSKSPELDRVATHTVIQAVHYLVDTLAADKVVSRPAVARAESHQEPVVRSHDDGMRN